MPNERRLARINKVIWGVVAKAIVEQGNLPPSIFISVTYVKVAPNLERVTVGVSVFPDARATEALKFLERHRVAIQSEINESLRVRRTPKINFQLDRTIAQATDLLNQANL